MVGILKIIKIHTVQSHTGGCYFAKKERPGIYPGQSDEFNFLLTPQLHQVIVLYILLFSRRTTAHR